MTRSSDANEPLVPAALMRKWQKLYDYHEREMKKVRALIDAAHGTESAPPVAKTVKASPPPKPPTARRAYTRKKRPKAPVRAHASRTVSVEEPAPAQTAVASRHKAGTWTGSILGIVALLDRPLPYPELKEKLADTPVGGLLQKSDKGFYGALAKLETEKLIVRYKGHLFTPSSFAKFQADLAAGRVRDLKVPNPAHHSPLGVAIVQFLGTRPAGAESTHIHWNMGLKPEFVDSLKNKTHMYNVLKRLQEQELIRKDGRRYFIVPQNGEAPSDQRPESASTSSDEGGTSSRSQGVA